MVAIKSFMPSLTTRMPLTTPTMAQHANATRIAGRTPQLCSTISIDIMMPPKPAQRPVEISTAPVISTKDTPSAVIATKGISVNIEEKFLALRKSGRKIVVITTMNSSGRNTLNSSERVMA